MTALQIAVVVIGWIGCGVATYGFTFAHFQDGWPELAKDWLRRDRSFAFGMALMGPVGLFVSFFCGGWDHGWRLR